MSATKPIVSSALVGVEWLRFACRSLLLLVKHTDYISRATDQGGSWRGEVPELRAALGALPPAKGSDVRNGFLVLVERMSGVEGPGDDETLITPEQLAVSETLWRGGLRLGAVLELEPWVRWDA